MEPLPHVVWIGGPPGTGKTSIARRLAADNDVRVYHTDAHTWVHHDRALALCLPATKRWEAMTPDERWVTTPPDEMARHSLELNADRFRLIVEDIRAFPSVPLIVAEGTPLLPWLVAPLLASRSHAVWLLPTPDVERAFLGTRATTSFDATSDAPRARENRLQRELLVAEAIERGARERSFATVRVDESRHVDAVQEDVAKLFAPVLERGPRATTTEERRALRRDENEGHARQILTYLARVPAAGNADHIEYAFACECGRTGCREFVRTAVSRYERVANAPEALTHSSHASE